MSTADNFFIFPFHWMRRGLQAKGPFGIFLVLWLAVSFFIKIIFNSPIYSEMGECSFVNALSCHKKNILQTISTHLFFREHLHTSTLHQILGIRMHLHPQL